MAKKLGIMMQIARAFEHIHCTGRVHGHLTSENILVNENEHVFVSDLGMNKIKKYAGIVSGYSNKSAWSSPELLRDRRLTPTKAEASDDVYSFAMIFWEIITEQAPFLGYDREDLYEKVGIEGYRPELPGRINVEIASIILLCWSNDPAGRPGFDVIVSKLSKLN